MESKTLKPDEAEMICNKFGFTREEFRECYKASNEKAEWCQYWRDRYSQRLGSAKGINERIRASIQADKQVAA